jgi:glycosyltransferase involved in cell wall biosynthesis
MSPDLSVVIISRNEEGTIERCIESVLQDTDQATEIVLVDSASADRTVTIAQKFPVTIVQLDETSLLSPSAGRYVGTSYCSSELIFYIDGDMVVYPGWIHEAMESFHESRLGGIGGKLYWVFPGEDLHMRSPDRLPVGSLECLGGAGIYRTSALKKCGTFNPFLLGEEERELGYRIRTAGLTLVRTDSPMAYHLAKPRTATEIDEKAKYFNGVGQILRAYGARRISREVIHEQRVEFAWFTGTIFLMVLAILFAAMQMYTSLLGLFVFIIFGVTLLVGVKGWKKVLLYFRGLFLSGRNLIKGFWRGIPAASEYSRYSTQRVLAQPGNGHSKT